MAFRAEDGDGDGAFAVEIGFRFGFLEAVGDGGDVAEADFRSIVGADDGDVAEADGVVAALLRAELEVAAGGAEGAAGDIERGIGDPFRDVSEGEAERAEGGAGDFHFDFRIADAGELDDGDVGLGKEAGLDFSGEIDEFALVEIAGDGDAHDVLAAAFAEGDDGRLDLIGKDGDALDGGGDFLEGAVAIEVGEELGGHLGSAFGGDGFEAFHHFQTAQFGLDGDDDGLLDFLRTGAAVLDIDDDGIEDEDGEDLLLDLENGNDADGEDDEHEEVRGVVVPGEPGEQAFFFGGADGSRMAWSFERAPGESAMPGRGALRSEMMRASPDSMILEMRTEFSRAPEDFRIADDEFLFLADEPDAVAFAEGGAGDFEGVFEGAGIDIDADVGAEEEGLGFVGIEGRRDFDEDARLAAFGFEIAEEADDFSLPVRGRHRKGGRWRRLRGFRRRGV